MPICDMKLSYHFVDKFICSFETIGLRKVAWIKSRDKKLDKKNILPKYKYLYFTSVFNVDEIYQGYA